MATTTKKTKTKTKRRPLSKPKAKRVNAPLLAASATVRKGKPSDKTFQAPVQAPAPASAPAPTALNPAFAMFQFMARVTAAYAELPSRLVQCRSPMDLWREQARFAQRIVGECRSTPPAPSRTAKQA
jgi:hypothetical protein